MVSFQCEGCGDVQTKKKLDSHRNHCHAPFTCIDCMKTFHGTAYRSHTSCMTEDQKYQGHLYREKPSKANKRKSVSILEPADQNALVARKTESSDLVAIDVPPAAPTPPSAIGARDSVFDYMIEDGPQGTPKILFADKKETKEVKEEQHDGQDEHSEGEMTMKNNAPSVFSRSNSQNGYKNEEERDKNADYDMHGFSYGAEPVNPRPLDMNGSSLSLDFMTPAAKTIKSKLDQRRAPDSVSHSRTNSASEKKRKRGQADELNGADSAFQSAPDTIVRSVVDTPGIVHSGLTGGLSRMVTDDNYPFTVTRSPSTSPEPQSGPAPVRKSKKHESPGSPLKRTKRAKDDSGGLGILIKGKAGKVLSMVGGGSLDDVRVDSNGNLVRTRRRTSSSDNVKESEKQERKKHKVTRYNGTSSANIRHEPRLRRHGSDDSYDEGKQKQMKAIEYNKHESNSDSDEAQHNGGQSQMVVFGAEEKLRQRCESFLSYVCKGPNSANGYSVNKALKRWHRDRDVHGTASKQDEEKELWRALRLKKNDRGEIVLFF